MSVTVTSQTVSDGDTVEVLPTQLDVTATVMISSSGAGPLRLDGIAWDVDASGNQLRNPYVEIGWLGAFDASSFPFTVETDNRNAPSFVVTFTPPLGRPLDDLSESVLLIRSDAYDALGEHPQPTFRIRFAFAKTANPRVTPNSYTFYNATRVKPETQEFRIYNDPELGHAAFRITSVSLEFASEEFVLTGAPAAGTTVLEPADPNYRDVAVQVKYQPMDTSEPDTNALLIDTDVPGAERLRVPLTGGATASSYSLAYSHVDRFDFSDVTSTQTRSVMLTCDGPGPMTVMLPHVEPAGARAHFTFTAWIPATTAGGSDNEIASWPRGLASGRSIRVDVTYSPSGSGNVSGQLIVPYENPDAGQLELALISAAP